MPKEYFGGWKAVVRFTLAFELFNHVLATTSVLPHFRHEATSCTPAPLNDKLLSDSQWLS